MSNTVRLAVMISGRGSNMEAILEAVENGEIDASVSIVISDKLEAKGIEKARERGVSTVALDLSSYSSKNEYEKDVIRLLENHKVDLVCLAGYMRVVGELLLQRYENKIINIHPSLLPSFKGLRAQKQALDYGVKYSGCTVHFVNSIIDGGAIISQEIVPVLESDTEETLSARILEKEHMIYPKAIQSVIESLVVKERK